jgi:hypothetical protein
MGQAGLGGRSQGRWTGARHATGRMHTCVYLQHAQRTHQRPCRWAGGHSLSACGVPCPRPCCCIAHPVLSSARPVHVAALAGKAADVSGSLHDGADATSSILAAFVTEALKDKAQLVGGASDLVADGIKSHIENYVTAVKVGGCGGSMGGAGQGRPEPGGDMLVSRSLTGPCGGGAGHGPWLGRRCPLCVAGS